MSHCPECAQSDLINRMSDKLALQAARIAALTGLVKKYRAEAVDQGADAEDLTEIDAVLKP